MSEYKTCMPKGLELEVGTLEDLDEDMEKSTSVNEKNYMIPTPESGKVLTELYIQFLVCSFENIEGDFELCMSHKHKGRNVESSVLVL